MRTRWLAPLFRLTDAGSREILMVVVDRDDLVFVLRRRATVVRLTEPLWRWRGALAGVREGDSLVIAVHGTPQRLCLSLNGNERCDFGTTLGEAWSLFHTVRRVPAAAEPAVEALCLFLLGLPAGMLIRRDAAGAVTALGVVAGAVVVPVLVGVSPLPAFQLAALAGGLAGGALVP